jgi:membrane-associated protease RseP (regulator of RpoE activity)
MSGLAPAAALLVPWLLLAGTAAASQVSGDAAPSTAVAVPLAGAAGANAAASRDDGGEPALGGGEPIGGERAASETGTLVRRGYLGVELTDLTPELRVHFGAPEDAGVMIARVVAGSPADRAGLKVGDVLTALDGQSVASSWEVCARVRPLDEGAVLTIEVRRAGELEVTTAGIEQRERREIDDGPATTSHGGRNRNLAASASRPRGATPSLQVAKTAREEELEKKLKALEKRLNELESRLPKP